MPEGTPPGIQVRIKAGYRAVAVPIDEVSGVSYQVKPGDRVDVVALVKHRAQGGGLQQSSRIILQNVEVATVGRQLHTNKKGETVMSAARSVTLLLRPAEVAINEIHYHPATGGIEFIELYNPGRNAIQLEDWVITGIQDREGSGSFLFPAGSAIPGEGYLLVVPVEEREIRRLRARGALRPAESQALHARLALLEVDQQVLQPQAYAASERGRLGWLEVGVAEAGHVALARRECCAKNVTFRRRDLRDLTPFRNRFHVAVALDSIVGPGTADVDRILGQVRRSLVEGGILLATFPAAPRTGKPVLMKLRNDRPTTEPLTFQELELQYRLRQAGFQGIRIRRFPDRSGEPACLLALAVRRACN